jgi:2,3-bisphosphoglycerate-independent phosphoglycerate mutase
MDNRAPVVLVILDGFGYSTELNFNAVASASMPTLTQISKLHPHVLLQASGAAVGLPEGMMGNSEVGHSTMGAGRIIKQPITVINDMIETGEFFKNEALLKCMNHARDSNTTLHLLGLLSDAGVHSSEKHLYALITMAAQHHVKKIVIHAFLDGRDSPPFSAAEHLEALQRKLEPHGGVIGSIHGRFYAMDRDTNWERTEKSIAVLEQPHKDGVPWQQALAQGYAQGISDEFIEPTVITPHTEIKPGDSVIFFNVREDRMRQLTSKIDKNIKPLCIVTAISYEPSLKTDVIYNKPVITHTLLDEIEKAGLRIFTIAETEKYAHVTYFFSGGKEIKRSCETRILIPSHKVKSYADDPCMSAPEITQAVTDSLKKDPCDFYLINFANADMVAHTGNFKATVEALECLDKQLAALYQAVVKELHGTLIITADHGKAEKMWDFKTQQPRTAHTTNLVPFYYVTDHNTPHSLPLTQLRDVAPFILKKLHIAIPHEMQ